MLASEISILSSDNTSDAHPKSSPEYQELRENFVAATAVILRLVNQQEDSKKMEASKIKRKIKELKAKVEELEKNNNTMAQEVITLKNEVQASHETGKNTVQHSTRSGVASTLIGGMSVAVLIYNTVVPSLASIITSTTLKGSLLILALIGIKVVLPVIAAAMIGYAIWRICKKYQNDIQQSSSTSKTATPILDVSSEQRASSSNNNLSSSSLITRDNSRA